MLKAFGNLHLWLLYGAIVLVALLAGYLLATPTDLGSLLPLGLLLGALLAPLLFRFHHELLIATWNATIIIFFLPGRPSLAMLLAGVSLFVAALHRAMLKRPMFLPVGSLLWPAAVLGLVIVVTALATGGIGGMAFGTQTFGARRYAAALFGVLGLFALCTRAVPPERVWWVAALFVLGAGTAALGDIAYVMNLDALFLLLDSTLAGTLAAAETTGGIARFVGVCIAGWALFSYLLMRYGLAGLMDLTKPWRLLAVAAAFGLTLAGGFRSYLVLSAMIFLVMIWLEGLYRTRAAILLGVVLVLGGAFLVAFADDLPLPMQRAISFLPVDVSHVARHDAQSTLDWRFEMWRIVVSEIPKYFWLGKGFSYDGTDYYLTLEAMRRGIGYKSYEYALVSGNYHHGILTLIIPFGIWGVIAFAWLMVAGARALWLNYRFSPPELLNVNRFLLAVFIVRLLFYLTLYGQFDLDLPLFTGLFGLSVALNGGIRRAAPAEAPAATEPRPASAPVLMPA